MPRVKFFLSLVFVVLILLANVQPVLAVNPQDPFGVGPQDFQTPAPCDAGKLGPCPADLNLFQAFIQRIIGLIVPLGIVAMLFMLVWAGVKFLTSGGEQAGLKQARETATWAMVGMLFLIIAWLVLLMIKAFTGVDVLNFSISFGS